MSQYDNKIFDSDLDAFKNSGAILNAALVFSGVVGGGSSQTRETSISVENPDFSLLLFDNSQRHSGKFKSVVLERITLIHESTLGGDLGVNFYMKISSSAVIIGGTLFNPSASAVALDTTTLNFKYIPYEATI